MTRQTTIPASPDQTKGSIQANESPRLNAASQFRTPPLFPEISACADAASLSPPLVGERQPEAGGAPVAAAGSFPDRVCAHCRAVLVRHENEQKRNFLVRRHCNFLCARLVRAAQSNASAPADRFCEDCDTLLIRRANEPRKHFIKRRFCNHDCSNRHACGKRNHGVGSGYSGFDTRGFPEPVDAGKEADLYGSQSYDSLRIKPAARRITGAAPTHVETQSAMASL